MLRLIEADLDRDLSLAVLADESGYSRSHFLRMFRSATGFTPHQYLVFRRIEKAKSLMKNSKATLVEIALDCGFSSHAHFTRVFQRTLNVAPSYFRRHL
ncbi:AraC-like DNA-binding protein [Granulicella aggregans]|uniref:AraC-like DNA-binding protein n=1 Tax=Granulicella aggregans TaxID=474949 RepID=A0A7W7ZJX6_9BACT|nr:AraC-like DNA-binding protein [Granulicella aggregans]